MKLLFVYGTLMRRSSKPMAAQLAASADHLGEAHCQAKLFDLGDYPGIVMSPDPSDIVFGDLYRLRDDDLLDRLDDYEGCAPGAAEPTEYIRRLVSITHDTEREAWTYLYNLPVDRLMRIATGRFEG